MKKMYVTFFRDGGETHAVVGEAQGRMALCNEMKQASRRMVYTMDYSDVQRVSTMSDGRRVWWVKQNIEQICGRDMAAAYIRRNMRGIYAAAQTAKTTGAIISV